MLVHLKEVRFTLEKRTTPTHLQIFSADIFTRIFRTNSDATEASTNPPTSRARRPQFVNNSHTVIPHPVESIQDSEYLHVGSNDTVLTVDPDAAHYVDGRLRHYVGWTLNAGKDSESISSIDSAAFWYAYTRSTQQAVRPP